MHISLTPELESRIKAKVDSGLYNNASEVIREALRFVETHEEWIYQIKLQQLKNELASGIKELDEGLGIPLNSEQAIDNFFSQLED